MSKILCAMQDSFCTCENYIDEEDDDDLQKSCVESVGCCVKLAPPNIFYRPTDEPLWALSLSLPLKRPQTCQSLIPSVKKEAKHAGVSLQSCTMILFEEKKQSIEDPRTWERKSSLTRKELQRKFCYTRRNIDYRKN